MSDLATITIGYMGQFVTDYVHLWAVPVGVCAVGLVLTTVINALRNK